MLACITACAGPPTSTSLQSEHAMTIEEIYDRHQTRSNPHIQRLRHVPDQAEWLSGYTRDVYNELDSHFPRLPNPTIILYVFPHLSPEGAPVPGYSTIFTLYESVIYALPGEILQP